MMMMSLKGKR